VQEVQNLGIHLHSDLEINKNSLTIVSIKANKSLKEGQAIVVHHKEIKSGVVLANVLTKVKAGHIAINIINMNDHNIVLTQGTKLSSAEYFHANEPGTIKDENINGNI
jgi:hypothetical protein